MRDRDTVLQRHDFLDTLDAETSAALACIARERAIGAGQTLFAEGEDVDGLYCVLDGLIKLVRFSRDGDEYLIGIAGPGEIIGEMALLGDDTRSADAIALGSCRLAFIDKASFFAFTDRHPAVYRALLRLLCRRLRSTSGAQARSHFLPVSGQIAGVIVRLAEHLGEPAAGVGLVIGARIRQQDIASMVGVARENVNRVLADMKRKGYLELRGGQLVIRDVEALRRMAAI